MSILRSVSVFTLAIFLSGCGGGYSTYGSNQGIRSSLDGQRVSPNPRHLDREPGERRGHLKVKVQFTQQAVGNRGPNDLCLLINDERVQKQGWQKSINFPGTPYDVLYYDKTIRAGHYKLKFYDAYGEPDTTAYEFDVESGTWYILYITIKNNRHFYRLEMEY